MRLFLLAAMVAVAAIMPASAKADDQQIADFIKARLVQEKQQGNLFGFNIDMRVDQGTVWFKGFVSNESQELLILRTAQLAGHLGVVQVVDDIEVNSPQQPTTVQPQIVTPQHGSVSASTLYTGQQLQLASNPVTESHNISSSTQVQNQTATTRLPQPANVAPQAPHRLQMPTAVNPPKRDDATQAVAYQEPVVSPLRIPNQGLRAPYAQPQGPAYGQTPPQPYTQPQLNIGSQPSFQQNVLQPIPALQTAAPVSQPAFAQPAAAPAAASAPLPFARAAAPAQGCTDCNTGFAGGGYAGEGTGIVHDNANLPGYAWPAYASHPNYGAVSYPKQYSASAWPYIGPFYPYPQVPLGWRKVSLEWDDGWWFLDFNDKN